MPRLSKQSGSDLGDSGSHAHDQIHRAALGDDLRVDPLTPDLAVVASSYSETRIDTEGHQVGESGFFTGLAEYRDGSWEFRNTHWSVPVPPSKVP